MTLESLSFDIDSLHCAYRAGLDPAAVIDEMLRRIDDVADPGIFLEVAQHKTLMDQVRALGRFDPCEKPLWGLPFAIKDNIDVAGFNTTAACPTFSYAPQCDAYAVALLRAAGAIAVGKTNMDQFATGLVGVRTPYPVPRNALDPLLVPGGSSSGSAVAVARGLVSFALGTDTAGSGRVPAALNGIVGLKPTLGAISKSGMIPACRTLDTISVFALTVEDAYRVYRSSAAPDPDDPFSRSINVPPLGDCPPRLRIAVPDDASREFFGDRARADSFNATVEQLRELGADVAPLDLEPFYTAGRLLYQGSWIAERMTVVEDLMKRSADAVHPVTRFILGGAKDQSAVDVFRDLHELAHLKQHSARIFRSVDMLCVPTIPTAYSLAQVKADPYEPNSRLGLYTTFANLLDLCGVAVPVASACDAEPGGVTLLAPAGCDVIVAAAASVLHRKSGGQMGGTGNIALPRSTTVPKANPNELPLAVVGAHMSGLPLNCELVRLGAHFLETTRTSPGYRLYLLGDALPLRPGMVRSSTSTATIELELWALPLSAVGKLLDQIPAPLSLGTLTLADGRTVKGFLCEAAGVEGAREITAFGGWRNFLRRQSAMASRVSSRTISRNANF